MALCDTFWGSHGCRLDVGHETVHRCWFPQADGGFDLCSEHNSETGSTRYAEVDFLDAPTGWSPWMRDGREVPR